MTPQSQALPLQRESFHLVPNVLVGNVKAATHLSNGLADPLAPASQVVALEDGELAGLVALEDGELAELAPLGEGEPAEVLAAQSVEFAPKYFSDIREHFVFC